MLNVNAAKTKWCPMARAEGNSLSKASINRTVEGNAHEQCRCLATGCMMWVEHSYDQGYCGLSQPSR
jgi:hypothetical protein